MGVAHYNRRDSASGVAHRRKTEKDKHCSCKYPGISQVIADYYNYKYELLAFLLYLLRKLAIVGYVQ